jgi:hypothetical protein
MANSKAKKKLLHKLRQRNGEGHDPRCGRGNWNGVKPITKVIKNKKKEAISWKD